MKSRWVFPVLLAAAAVGCTQSTSETAEEMAALREEVALLRDIAGAPPSSLDNLYPPVAPGPVLLQEMMELATALTGLGVDVFEQDGEHVPAGFEQFRAKYAAVAQLVPEWESAYPLGPVEELGMALETGDPERIGAAFEGVGVVCHDCHVANMAKVHFVYRWPDFGMIQLPDPSTGRALSWKEIMREMENAFVGMSVDLQQQQTDNARAHFDTFRARFDLLKVGCGVCHASERSYFVDPTVTGMIQQLGAVLESDTPDGAAAAQLGEQIGMESCSKCHLVHAPAAMYKASLVEGGH